jgi:hypothetical protein
MTRFSSSSTIYTPCKALIAAGGNAWQHGSLELGRVGAGLELGASEFEEVKGT